MIHHLEAYLRIVYSITRGDGANDSGQPQARHKQNTVYHVKRYNDEPKDTSILEESHGLSHMLPFPESN